ncbi:response regulator [Caenispirillum salinarum]|uniref:response regulator n=1 Tax=Caenispirillum salinarum TaxID=859058 RepID=UPI00384AEEC4
MTIRILVVEDDIIIRQGFVTVLELEGFVVREAADGREALEVLPDWRPDVILLDLMMPVMTGWDFREAQLGDSALAAIPVIIMSGFADSEGEVATLKPAAHLQKPVSFQAMVDKIHHVHGS